MTKNEKQQQENIQNQVLMAAQEQLIPIPTKTDENGKEDADFAVQFLNKIPTVQELRKENRVRVVHRRFYHNFPYPLTKEQASGVSMVMDLGGVYPRGGYTEVYIYNKENQISKGVSICHFNDNFNRSKAVKYAIYRALGGKVKENQ